jgi:hypothetical protein
VTPVHSVTTCFLKISFNIITLKWRVSYRYHVRLKHYVHLPWFSWLVAGLSPRRPGFAPGSVHVGFVVDK